jgi:phosphate transport system ATP-binding protein
MDKIVTEDLSLYYGEERVLTSINLKIPENNITAIIGPSGCGKSSFLRCINRMNDLILHSRLEGKIFLDGEDIHEPNTDVVEIRRKVGMVFQKPNPFPKSIYDNVAYGLRIKGLKKASLISEIVEKSLVASGLFKEVKNELHKSAMELSGGQQQRLCIARALAIEPEVLLMDEPCSALDPASTFKIEDLMSELKKSYTIIIVTHNMQQAARVSDWTGFLYLGQLIEFNETSRLFAAPKEQLTENYITGRFG